MALFLVERYAPPGADLPRGVAETHRLAAAMDSPDRPVRHVLSIRVDGDETCLSLFEAPSAGIVADLNRRAGFPFDRITDATAIAVADPGGPS